MHRPFITGFIDDLALPVILYLHLFPDLTNLAQTCSFFRKLILNDTRSVPIWETAMQKISDRFLDSKRPKRFRLLFPALLHIQIKTLKLEVFFEDFTKLLEVLSKANCVENLEVQISKVPRQSTAVSFVVPPHVRLKHLVTLEIFDYSARLKCLNRRQTRALFQVFGIGLVRYATPSHPKAPISVFQRSF
jgi:hypothetical protein